MESFGLFQTKSSLINEISTIYEKIKKTDKRKIAESFLHEVLKKLDELYEI
jgi:hypothetical protein